MGEKRRSLFPAVAWVVALVCLVASPAYGESIPPGTYGDIGQIVSVDGTSLVLRNGRNESNYDLVDETHVAALEAAKGKWVRLQFKQTNRSGWGALPLIRDLEMTVLHDTQATIPLAVYATPAQTKMAFGDVLSLTCRLRNRSKATVEFASPHVFPYLTAKNERGYEVALGMAENTPGYVGLYFKERTLAAGAEMKFEMTCTNLVPPGKYTFRVAAPTVEGIQMLSEGIEVVVSTPSKETTIATLERWMDKATFPQQMSIAWILWRDFDNHVGMHKLIKSMDARSEPSLKAAGIIAAAQGKAGIEPFLRAFRKAWQSSSIRYWCEQARQSPARVELFQRMLQERRPIPIEYAGKVHVPVAQFVADHLTEHLEGGKRFTWTESNEERERVVKEFQKILETEPTRFRCFDPKRAFNPESIDGLMRRQMYWGS